jgi:hypothetical protein
MRVISVEFLASWMRPDHLRLYQPQVWIRVMTFTELYVTYGTCVQSCRNPNRGFENELTQLVRFMARDNQDETAATIRMRMAPGVADGGRA